MTNYRIGIAKCIADARKKQLAIERIRLHPRMYASLQSELVGVATFKANGPTRPTKHMLFMDVEIVPDPNAEEGMVLVDGVTT